MKEANILENSRAGALLREYFQQFLLYLRKLPERICQGFATGAVFRAIGRFLRKNTVLDIALAAAVVTMFLVPPDAAYRDYFDWKTLTCLFSVLAVVGALTGIQFFYRLAQRIIRLFRTARGCVMALLFVTFVGSMLIANDMALITFLPLGFFVLHSAGQEKRMAFVFILQNIAANLGGMLTPFGNPQNLYLYSFFSVPTMEFMRIMLWPFVGAMVLLAAVCLLIPREPLSAPDTPAAPVAKWRLPLYMTLFALAIAIVFKGIPYWIGLLVIPPVLFFVDRQALRQVDYPLLLTFCCFFVFSGNMARIPAVRNLLESLMAKDTLLVGILSCQCISNVPSAILLSRFTANYRELLWAVNIGGTGTLIASLASLITYGEFCRHKPGEKRRYLLLFTGLNLFFLLLLTVLCLLLR